jgi:hypothetical protein
MPSTVKDLTDFNPIFIRYDLKIAPKSREAAAVSTDPALQMIAKGVVDGDEDMVADAAKAAIAKQGPQAVIDNSSACWR